MKNFKETILETKKVSVWGIGYLGYTTVLRVQENGFLPVVYDFTTARLDALKNNKYPNKEQLNSWSKNGKVPKIDLDQITITDNYEELFENKIHIVSFPNIESNYNDLAQLFVKNSDKLKNSLVVFQSAGVPKSVENDFMSIMRAHNIELNITTIFRSDWTVEDFFDVREQRVVSGNTNESIVNAQEFLKLLHLDSKVLSDIEEAEVYENTKIALNYTLVAFFNQLSLSYPHININELSKQLLTDISFNNLSLGVSSVDYKSEQSCENIIRGSQGDFLSILREANSTNLSFLFYYVNLLKNKGIKSITIFGLSSHSSLKDIKLSPSVILAEYLNKFEIEVSVLDQSFSKNELQNILPFVKTVDISNDTIASEAVIVMNLDKELKSFNQQIINKVGLDKVKYIIDNTGFFKDFKYSINTIYHQLGDGNLIKVNN